MITNYLKIGSQELPINFGLACLRELEQQFGCSVTELGAKIEAGGLDAAISLIHIGLKHGHRRDGKEYTATLEETCDLLDTEGLDSIEQAFTLLANSLTGQKKTRAKR